MDEKIPVPLSFMEKADTYYSAMTLNQERDKSTGKVMCWRGKYWTCTGVVSCHLQLEQMDLCEVVLESQYEGPPPDPDRRGPGYYTGMRFRQGMTWWVLTDHRMTLVPDGTPKETQPGLF